VGFSIAFAPLVPPEVLWAAIALAVLLAALLILVRSRGALVRAVALAFVALALANPSFTREDREALPSVAVVVLDKSPSQEFGDRLAQTEAARAAVTQRLSRIANLEVRVVRRTAKPTARACSRRSVPRSPTCRPTASPAPSSSPTAASTTCRRKRPRSASPHRCTR